MITINCKHNDDNGDVVCRVHLNGVFICSFEHGPHERFSECLQKAADAVKLNEWAEFELMNDSKGG